jgi:hypothetical protein
VPGIEDETDRLFGLPLDEFTTARNGLARQLKRDGDAEGAAAVQALPKPTVAAWTVNQLARGDAAAVRTLLDAAEALRAAQNRLLGGEDASDALRQATIRERDGIARIDRARRGGLAGSRPARATGDAREGGFDASRGGSRRPGTAGCSRPAG